MINQIFKDLLHQLLQGKALSVEDIIDLLTLQFTEKCQGKDLLLCPLHILYFFIIGSSRREKNRFANSSTERSFDDPVHGRNYVEMARNVT